jgi:DNA-directed RNA polymerase specialized sigma24 family protein
MIKNIAYGLAHASNFINYTFKEDAIGDSLINMFNALKQKKYNFNKGSNPFSYFNSISFNCWRSRIKKEKRMRDTLAAYQEEVYSIVGPDVGVDNPVNPAKRNENF